MSVSRSARLSRNCLSRRTRPSRPFKSGKVKPRPRRGASETVTWEPLSRQDEWARPEEAEQRAVPEEAEQRAVPEEAIRGRAQGSHSERARTNRGADATGGGGRQP